MKRFRFRLESLLEIKKRAEEEIKKKLALKNAEILNAKRDQQELETRLASFFAEEKLQRLRVLDPVTLRFSISYRTQLQKDIGQKKQQVEKLSAEKENIRVLLTEAKKETRVLEILKEKKLAQWKKEYKMEEQEFVDDVSQKGHIRKMRAASAAKEPA
jgi:flagellar FliJ protein